MGITREELSEAYETNKHTHHEFGDMADCSPLPMNNTGYCWICLQTKANQATLRC